MVLWIIGMSDVGKTAIGREVYNILRKKHNNLVFFDGDIFREIMGNDLGHIIEDRKENANRICRVCRFLDSQGIHVICAILSIFHESQIWNRKHIKDYYEVYLRASFETLFKRDSKGLYRQAREGKISNVVGVDIEFPEPLKPDLIIENNGNGSIENIADNIVHNMAEKINI